MPPPGNEPATHHLATLTDFYNIKYHLYNPAAVSPKVRWVFLRKGTRINNSGRCKNTENQLKLIEMDNSLHM